MVINGLERDFRFIWSDSVTFTVDSLHDRQSGFEFATNPLGAKYDTQFSNDGGRGSANWDGVWDVKTSRNSDGWIAEFMIPFKTLRFSDSPSQEWGVNMGRRVLRVNEVGSWAPIPTRYNSHRVSLAGTLTGLEGIRQGRNLWIKPFVTGGVTQVRDASGQLQTIQALSEFTDQQVGGDLKYSLTPSLTLDATYHTDFAQVEVDQQQVNLTRFNLFFPEKRDFFLENDNNFTVGPGGNLLPFFSRRIGLSAAGTPIPIVGGVRVSGKLNEYDVGFLEMKTEQQGATPSNNYLVGRIRRNLLGSSWIGGLVTSRDSTVSGDYNRVYGADAHFQFRSRLEFDAYLLQSDTPGKSGSSQARRFQSAWRDDELMIGGEYNEVQPNFNPEARLCTPPESCAVRRRSGMEASPSRESHDPLAQFRCERGLQRRQCQWRDRDAGARGHAGHQFPGWCVDHLRCRRHVRSPRAAAAHPVGQPARDHRARRLRLSRLFGEVRDERGSDRLGKRDVSLGRLLQRRTQGDERGVHAQAREPSHRQLDLRAQLIGVPQRLIHDRAAANTGDLRIQPPRGRQCLHSVQCRPAAGQFQHPLQLDASSAEATCSSCTTTHATASRVSPVSARSPSS